jgi:hypothetical protein
MKKKLQETYDLAVREVLSNLSIINEDDDCYTLTVDKNIYDNLINAEYALITKNIKGA